MLVSPLWPDDFGFEGEVHALGALEHSLQAKGWGCVGGGFCKVWEPQFPGQHESLFAQMLATPVLFAVDVLFYLF